MEHEAEIIYRDQILQRVRDGNAITSEERLWLSTHRLYNRMLGYPYLNADVIELNTSKNCIIHVKIEEASYDNRIIPVITVPAGKGKILSEALLTDYKGNVINKPVKMLGVLLDAGKNEAQFTYQSSLGLLGVSYECDFFDSMQGLLIRKDSGTGDPNFAMICEKLSDRKILYRCKAPGSPNFDSLVFSVEW